MNDRANEKTTSWRQRTSGFTLVELAISVAVFALLLGGGILIFTKQTELQREKDARQLLAGAKEALLGYAQAHGRLPCPALATGDGTEAPAGGGVCTQSVGYLPARTLGIADHPDGYLYDPRAKDTPAGRIRYAVTTDPPAAPSAATTANGIKGQGMSFFAGVTAPQICETAAPCATSQTAVAVLLAPGGNIRNNPTGNGADEIENLNGDTKFVNHERAAPGAPGGEFDDLLEWIAPAQLAARMVQAGQLP